MVFAQKFEFSSQNLIISLLKSFIFSPSAARLSSIMQNWNKSLSFHNCIPKGQTNFKCPIWKLHTLNYHNWCVPFFTDYRACALTSQQIGCLATQSVLTLLEGVSCGSDKSCHDGLQTAEKSAKDACDISLNFICDLSNCPENRYKEICAKHKNVTGK